MTMSGKDKEPEAILTEWRLKGNQAFAKGDLREAEECYTSGLNCVSPNEKSMACIEAMVLCYSNRAAARMHLGRMREALVDCMAALALEPESHKVQLRAANCYLELGEIEEATKYFMKLKLQSSLGVHLDRKLVTEAFDGLQKAVQVSDYMDQTALLLQEKTSVDAERALEVISKGLSISHHSDKLIEMKAEALLKMQKYEDVIELCEQTLDSAQKNSIPVSAGGTKSSAISPVRLWRWRLISKSYFYLGKLEEALELLQKQEQAGLITEKCVTVSELLRHKTAGNEAFQSERYSDAVRHYTCAISGNDVSRPFAAICICNRATTYKALGEIAEAIADCSLAMALDGDYPKAIYRRASLHEMIRNYRQAINDLQRYLSLLQKKYSEDKATEIEISEARLRLSRIKQEAMKDVPLDMYLILGVRKSATAMDIKNAYHRASLRHHPDKAGQLLGRSGIGDGGLWKEIAKEVHKDADILFKLIGNAYAVLQDPVLRSRFDREEEKRKA
ncbi:PREDICTED: dnaJ homolog subfamily C member 7-like [Nelumbo nucifera]|uniref:DnaJ homolog subfamily C member 7-like n=2 Tax=Nelumbo nucifera TaxID=4432 RepID=A0A1U8B456_NELNU|nr:PREDICTED: dnaJ homolog subfamily C member 7-like [Nelumbo nucifera]DAD43697.1 TPA_asm: hypothetical protein HUJ06_001927 [Nelumbo nucifera]